MLARDQGHLFLVAGSVTLQLHYCRFISAQYRHRDNPVFFTYQHWLLSSCCPLVVQLLSSH